MRKLATNMSGEYYVPVLDTLLNSNLFKNNTYKIYVATSTIEQLYKKKLMNNDINFYQNIFYKKNTRLEYFDENAWVDFKIGMDSEEIFGFSHSGFSANLNRLKETRNYYN